MNSIEIIDGYLHWSLSCSVFVVKHCRSVHASNFSCIPWSFFSQLKKSDNKKAVIVDDSDLAVGNIYLSGKQNIGLPSWSHVNIELMMLYL
jgi:hypothetical protein